ncbi:hypothetical protein FF1_018128 [Malus domestica]
MCRSQPHHLNTLLFFFKPVPVSFLQTHSSHSKPFFSSPKFTRTTQKTNKLQNTLRVIDLITPKPSPAVRHRQGHLRLIQDFLQSDFDHFTVSSTSSDPRPDMVNPNLLDLFGDDWDYGFC